MTIRDAVMPPSDSASPIEKKGRVKPTTNNVGKKRLFFGLATALDFPVFNMNGAASKGSRIAGEA